MSRLFTGICLGAVGGASVTVAVLMNHDRITSKDPVTRCALCNTAVPTNSVVNALHDDKTASRDALLRGNSAYLTNAFHCDKSTSPLNRNAFSTSQDNVSSTDNSDSSVNLNHSDKLRKLTFDDGLVDPLGVLVYGDPGPVVDRITSPSLSLAYNRQMRNPAWVAEHLTEDSLARRDGNRRNSEFYEDDRIPQKFRAHLADYSGSGYDRGHQVPAADAKWSQDAMNATFALTNICPQVGDGFNRDYWAHFEDFCRRLVRQYKYPSVRIITGPLYMPMRDKDGRWKVSYEVIGDPPNVAVPTHFYKVIFAEGQGKQDKRKRNFISRILDLTGLGRHHTTTSDDSVAIAAFVLPNKPIDNNIPLLKFQTDVSNVTKASGLDFVSQLPESRRRKLCDEVNCSLQVRKFNNSARQMSSAPKNQ